MWFIANSTSIKLFEEKQQKAARERGTRPELVTEHWFHYLHLISSSRRGLTILAFWFSFLSHYWVFWVLALKYLNSCFLTWFFFLLDLTWHVLCLSFSRVRLFATPHTVAHQAPLSMGIFRARILEWVVMPSSRRSSQSRDRSQVPCIAGRFFIIWATREAQE